jgi:NTE family protein
MAAACPRGRLWRMSVLGCALCLAACAVKPYVNERLPMWDPLREQQVGRLMQGQRSPELLVLVAFSGGGLRAASLAYGVMQELAATTVTTSLGTRRLLDEVDIISSVSGGSFVAAYYGLFGDRLFEDFEQRLLRRNIEEDLIKGLLAPSHWGSMGSRYYGRSDMAAAFYDEILFDRKTFADLLRPDAPLVLINSTDIGTGATVGFSYSQFDLICSDLASYPVSRAVAASSAMPGIATPITLQNFAGSCGFLVPAHLRDPMPDTQTTITSLQTRYTLGYLDAHKQPWLHLVDGGIGDNLGLRPFYTLSDRVADPRQIFHQFNHPDVRQILIIAVNASIDRERDWARQGAVPSATQVLTAVSAIQMGRYNADTIHLVRDAYQQWAEAVTGEGRPVNVDFVEVNFASLPDAQERQYLNRIPTKLKIRDEQVDRVVAAGRQSLRGAPEFRRFLSQWGAAACPSGAC